MKINRIPNSLTFGLPITRAVLREDDNWRHSASSINYHWDINSKSKGGKWLNLIFRFIFSYNDNYLTVKIADNKVEWRPDRTKRKPFIEVKYDINQRVNYTTNGDSFRDVRFIHDEYFYPSVDIPTEIEVSNFKRFKDITDGIIEDTINYSYEKAIDEGIFDEAISEIKKDIERIQMQFIDDVNVIQTLNPKRKENLTNNV